MSGKLPIACSMSYAELRTRELRNAHPKRYGRRFPNFSGENGRRHATSFSGNERNGA
jgi:hypothetical protein